MDIKTAMNCLWAEVARYNKDSRVREAWQTLNTAVSELSAHNKQSTPCAEHQYSTYEVSECVICGHKLDTY